MGKGSQNNSETVSSTNKLHHGSYKWEEVQKHNKMDDCWIVLDDSVYDVSKFMRRHPGGPELIELYAGQYATEAYKAFHGDLLKADKYKKAYCIGKMDPNEMFPNDQMDEKERARVTRRNAIRSDFEQLRLKAIEMGLFKSSVTFYAIILFHVVATQIGAYYILLKYGYSFYPVLAAFVLLAISQTQNLWSYHDFSHSSVISRRWDRILFYFFSTILQGTGGNLWLWNHTAHHAKCNVMDKDPDIAHPWLIFSPEHARRTAKKNADGTEMIYWPYNFQHIVLVAIDYAFFGVYLLVKPLYYSYQRKYWADLLLPIIHYIIYFSVTLTVFPTIWHSLLFLTSFRMVEAAWFMWTSQSSHIPMDKVIVDDIDTWVELQLLTTCNQTSSAFNDWFSGHLNFQIEHHLFPTMPRHNLYKIQPYVKELCKKHNVKYVSKTMLGAFYDLYDCARDYGTVWKDTYTKLMSEKKKAS